MTDPVLAVLAQWPWLLLVIGCVTVLTYGLKGAHLLKTIVWNPLVEFLRRASKREQRRVTEERARVDAELDDLRRQVSFLIRQVGELRDRDELNWSWILSDQEYHRQLEFMAIDKGWDIPKHVSYMAHREEWIVRHPIPEAYLPSV